MPFPYYSSYPYMQQPIQQPQQNSGLIWVQGIEAAKSYPVSSGQSILLMDSECNVFYIKSADMSGMPLPLRVFDYTERDCANKAPTRLTESSSDFSSYITRKEFEERIELLMRKYGHIEKEGENDE